MKILMVLVMFSFTFSLESFVRDHTNKDIQENIQQTSRADDQFRLESSIDVCPIAENGFEMNPNIIVTRIKTENGYDGLKINFSVQSSMKNFIQVLNDVDQYKYWAYNCLEAKIYQNNLSGNVKYYTVIDFPFPMEDRILAADCNQKFDESGRFISKSTGITNQIDTKGYEPLPYFESQWIVTPKKQGELAIEYTIVTDPVHNIPALLYNLAVEHGPYKTMESLSERVEKFNQPQIK